MIIKRYTGINNRGIWSIILEGMKWLEEQGFSEDALTVSANGRVVVAHDAASMIPMGFIVYYPYPESNYLFINLSYVKPLDRRAGVYNYMWEEIKKIASEEDCERIMAVMHPDNKQIQLIAEAQGFHKFGITYEYTGIRTKKEIAEERAFADAQRFAEAQRFGEEKMREEKLREANRRTSLNLRRNPIITTINAPTGPDDDRPF